MKVGILTPTELTAKTFNFEYAPKIEIFMENPEVSFILYETAIIAIRFLHNRGYRNCVIYHMGANPAWNPAKYSTKRLQTREECVANIILDSDILVGE